MKILQWIESYFVLEFVLAAAAILFTLWGRKKRLRFKMHKPPQGFIETDETFVDPTTGIQQRVWYNPTTGKRYYEVMKE